MALNGGASEVTAVKFGGGDIGKVMVGDEQVWPVAKAGLGIEVLSSNETYECEIPAHQAGDVIIVFGTCYLGDGIPTIPAAGGTVPAWVDLGAILDAEWGYLMSRVAYVVATDSTTTTGRWQYADDLNVIVVRGARGVGAFAPGGVSAKVAEVMCPALTLSNTSGSSAVLDMGFAFGSGVSVTNNVPDGYTLEYSKKAGNVAKSVISKTRTTTAPAVSVMTIQSTDLAWLTWALEVLS